MDRITLSTQVDRVARARAADRQLGHPVLARDGERFFANGPEGLQVYGPHGDTTLLSKNEDGLGPVGPVREQPDGSLVLFRGRYRHGASLEELASVGPEGAPRWKVPLNDGEGRRASFLEDRVVLAGNQAARAISLDQGTELWSHPLPRFSRTAVGPDGSLVVAADGELYRLTPAGKRQELGLEAPPDQSLYDVWCGRDGTLLTRHSQQLTCYEADGRVRWTRAGHGEAIPLAEGPGVLYRQDETALQGLDPKTGELLWQVEARPARDHSVQDPEGRLRFCPEHAPGELWTLDAAGGVSVQTLPGGELADSLQVLAEGSTLVTGFESVFMLPPPGPAQKTPFQSLQEATARATGLRVDELSHLGPEEWAAVGERARDINRSRSLAVSEALRTRSSCELAEKPYLQEQARLVALIKNPDLSPEARAGALATWSRRLSLDGWQERLFPEGAASSQLDWLYRAAPDLIGGNSLERLRELPEETQLQACRSLLGEHFQGTDDPPVYLDACLRVRRELLGRGTELMGSLGRGEDAARVAEALIREPELLADLEQIRQGGSLPSNCLAPTLGLLTGQQAEPVPARDAEESRHYARVARTLGHRLTPELWARLGPALEHLSAGRFANQMVALTGRPKLGLLALEGDSGDPVAAAEALLGSHRLEPEEAGKVSAWMAERLLEGDQRQAMRRLAEMPDSPWLADCLRAYLGPGVEGEPLSQLRSRLRERLDRAEVRDLASPELGAAVGRLGQNTVVGGVRLRSRA